MGKLEIFWHYLQTVRPQESAHNFCLPASSDQDFDSTAWALFGQLPNSLCFHLELSSLLKPVSISSLLFMLHSLLLQTFCSMLTLESWKLERTFTSSPQGILEGTWKSKIPRRLPETTREAADWGWPQGLHRVDQVSFRYISSETTLCGSSWQICKNGNLIKLTWHLILKMHIVDFQTMRFATYMFSFCSYLLGQLYVAQYDRFVKMEILSNKLNILFSKCT